MIRPEIDGRLALRIREIAKMQTDTLTGVTGRCVILAADEKARILNAGADLLEEYIIAVRESSSC